MYDFSLFAVRFPCLADLVTSKIIASSHYVSTVTSKQLSNNSLFRLITVGFFMLLLCDIHNIFKDKIRCGNACNLRTLLHAAKSRKQCISSMLMLTSENRFCWVWINCLILRSSQVAVMSGVIEHFTILLKMSTNCSKATSLHHIAALYIVVLAV